MDCREVGRGIDEWIVERQGEEWPAEQNEFQRGMEIGEEWMRFVQKFKITYLK